MRAACRETEQEEREGELREFKVRHEGFRIEVEIRDQRAERRLAQ